MIIDQQAELRTAQERLFPSRGLRWHSLKPFGAVLVARDNSDCDVQAILSELQPRLLREKVILVRGFGDRLGLEEVATSLGEVAMQDGKPNLYDVVEQAAGSADGVLTTGRVPLHWDGFWTDDDPHFQVFKCLVAPRPGYGGETLFANTSTIYQSAPEKRRELWDQQVFVYCPPTRDRGEQSLAKTVFGQTRAYPLTAVHPLTGQPVLRFRENDQDVGRTLDRFGMSDWRGSSRLASVYFDLLDRLYSPKHCLTVAWQTGDLVLTDNLTLLHGRKPYSGARRLNRLLVRSRPSSDGGR